MLEIADENSLLGDCGPDSVIDFRLARDFDLDTCSSRGRWSPWDRRLCEEALRLAFLR